MWFLDLHKRNMRNHERVLIADENRTAFLLVKNDIKPVTAYVCEIDLDIREYSDAIHDRDDNHSPSPKVMQIKTKTLTKRQMRLRILYYYDSNFVSRKLKCSLLPKTSYVIFSKTVKCYILRKLKVTTLYKAICLKSKTKFLTYI